MKPLVVGVLIVSAWCAQAQPEKAYQANEAGLAAYARADYARAEQLYEQAIEIWRAEGAKFEPHLSITLYNFGQALCQDGKWAEGERVFTEGLSLARKNLGPKNINTVSLFNALGAAEFVRGETEAAEDNYNQALTIGRELFPNHVQTRHALMSMSGLRMRQHRSDEAVQFADEALRLTLEADGENTVEGAMAYSCAAQARRAQGRPELAIPLFRKARALWTAIAPNSPRVASLMSQEGLALMDDGQLGQAEKDMKGALTILSRCNGCGYELAVAQTNWGVLLSHKGKLSEAAAMLNSALKIEQQITGSDSGLSTNTREAIAKLRAQQTRRAARPDKANGLVN